MDKSGSNAGERLTDEQAAPPSSVPTEQITAERLGRWSKRMSQAHATPLLLLGVGHDHNSGRLVLCTLEEQDMPIAKLIGFLKMALWELEG